MYVTSYPVIYVRARALNVGPWYILVQTHIVLTERVTIVSIKITADIQWKHMVRLSMVQKLIKIRQEVAGSFGMRQYHRSYSNPGIRKEWLSSEYKPKLIIRARVYILLIRERDGCTLVDEVWEELLTDKIQGMDSLEL